MNLKGRDFLKLLDFSGEEITYLIDLAEKLKTLKKDGVPHRYCNGKNIALIFEKTSTRTRCSFEVAAHDLGMGVTYLDPQGSQIGKKESIADTARVLSSMFEGIEYRGFAQKTVEELAPDADTCRYADHTGTVRQTERHKFCLHGRRTVQHGQLAYGRLRKTRAELHGMLSRKIFSVKRPRCKMRRVCKRKRLRTQV